MHERYCVRSGLDDDDEPEPSAFSKLYLMPVLRAYQETISAYKKKISALSSNNYQMKKL
jgi:hypothetical protein